jgi:hypothetical protein
MAKLMLPFVNTLGFIIFLSVIDSSFALSNNIFADVGDADADADQSYTISYTSSRGKSRSGGLEPTESAGNDVDISNGIYRGEASVYTPERDNHELHEAGSTRGAINSSNEGGASTDSPSPERVDQVVSELNTWDVGGNTNNNVFSEPTSCKEGTENLLEMNEDIRSELSVIDRQYLEHAGIENACIRDEKISTCDFDFRDYPSNLQMVCENDDGIFYRTEHSIQCYDLSTMESLYYQFDYYPSCFPAFCGEIDVKRLVTERIDSITETMSEFLEMTCFADDDILRLANDASLIVESSGSSNRLWHWIQLVSVLPFLLVLVHSM